MKMCTLVGYPSLLSFNPVMPLWNFETIHHAPCHKSPTCLMQCLWNWIYSPGLTRYREIGTISLTRL